MEAALATLSFILPLAFEPPDLPAFLGNIIDAWRRLYVIAFSGSVIFGLLLAWLTVSGEVRNAARGVQGDLREPGTPQG